MAAIEAEKLRRHLSITGVVTDADRRAIGNATVELTQEGKSVASGNSEFSGSYWLLIRPESLTNRAAPLQLIARKGDLTCAPTNLSLNGAEDLNLVLRDFSSLSGRVLAFDESPLPGVVVQALPVNEPLSGAAYFFSRERAADVRFRDGEYQVYAPFRGRSAERSRGWSATQ